MSRTIWYPFHHRGQVHDAPSTDTLQFQSEVRELVAGYLGLPLLDKDDTEAYEVCDQKEWKGVDAEGREWTLRKVFLPKRADDLDTTFTRRITLLYDAPLTDAEARSLRWDSHRCAVVEADLRACRIEEHRSLVHSVTKESARPQSLAIVRASFLSETGSNICPSKELLDVLRPESAGILCRSAGLACNPPALSMAGTQIGGDSLVGCSYQVHRDPTQPTDPTSQVSVSGYVTQGALSRFQNRCHCPTNPSSLP